MGIANADNRGAVVAVVCLRYRCVSKEDHNLMYFLLRFVSPIINSGRTMAR
jgi:hypothetical protein